MLMCRENKLFVQQHFIMPPRHCFFATHFILFTRSLIIADVQQDSVVTVYFTVAKDYILYTSIHHYRFHVPGR